MATAQLAIGVKVPLCEQFEEPGPESTDDIVRPQLESKCGRDDLREE